jgi:Flp pilus assembly pilin Flp
MNKNSKMRGLPARRGAGLVEYAIAAGLISVVVMMTLSFTGGGISGLYDDVAISMESTPAAGGSGNGSGDGNGGGDEPPAGNQPPTITALSDVPLDSGESTGPSGFTVSDPDGDTGALTVDAVSDNQTVLPDANITLSDLGGGNWTIEAATVGGEVGAATVTITVDDGEDSTTEDFTVTASIPAAGPPAAWSWGEDASGKLGNGAVMTSNLASPWPVDYAGAIPDSWASLSAAFTHGCGVASDGSGWCWGSSGSGKLGNGTSSGIFDTPQPVSAGYTWQMIHAGVNHTCGITTGNTLYCWGSASDGRLGNAFSSGSFNVPAGLVSAPSSWIDVDVGATFTCGIASGGAAYCWGDDGFGQLGNGGAISPNTPVSTPSAVSTASSPATYTAIAVGNSHACGIATGGAVWCWGAGGNGRLGGGSGNETAPVAVTTSGGRPAGYSKLDAGDVHNCGISSADSSLWCWGYDSSGQLGNGPSPFADQYAPYLVASGGGIPTAWSQVSAGGASTCGVGTDGSGWCWGLDSGEQLGNGSALTANQSAPSQVDATGGRPASWSMISIGTWHALGLSQ